MDTVVSGRWDITILYAYGSGAYTAYFEQNGTKLRGTFRGQYTEGDLDGKIEGNRLQFRCGLRIEGMNLIYDFIGTIDETKMVGTVSLDEYGEGKWTAVKHTKF